VWEGRSREAPPYPDWRASTYTRIGVLQALNRNIERTFSSLRSETHWGRRKLKRDE